MLKMKLSFLNLYYKVFNNKRYYGSIVIVISFGHDNHLVKLIFSESSSVLALKFWF